MKFSSSAEARWAAVGITCCIGAALALVIVPLAIAPIDDWSFPNALNYLVLGVFNALFFLVTQMLIVLAALICRPRPPVIGGVAVAASLYLAAFGMWVRTFGSSDHWVGYLFSLPGAMLGALAISAWLKSKPQMAPVAAFCISATAVIVGVSINQTAICKTVMYCVNPWK